MNRADFNYLNQLEAQLRAMHQSCPSHELAYDEDDFQRVFGAGDEQQHKPRRIDRVQFDHGHVDRDFA